MPVLPQRIPGALVSKMLRVVTISGCLQEKSGPCSCKKKRVTLGVEGTRLAGKSSAQQRSNPPRSFDWIVTLFQYKERASRLATSLGKLLVDKNKARTEVLQRLAKVRAGTAIQRAACLRFGAYIVP